MNILQKSFPIYDVQNLSHKYMHYIISGFKINLGTFRFKDFIVIKENAWKEPLVNREKAGVYIMDNIIGGGGGGVKSYFGQIKNLGGWWNDEKGERDKGNLHQFAIFFYLLGGSSRSPIGLSTNATLHPACRIYVRFGKKESERWGMRMIKMDNIYPCQWANET